MSQVKGKIVYIEPNNLYQELGVHLNNGDNINWEPENLGISVDLQVIVADRDNCGKTAICDDFTFNVSSNNAKDKYWQSFLNGENLSGEKDKEELYLTDNYTDVSYQEILNNNAGSKEALGIQSIDISFDSHFFPIVKIKMIDVRGFSLMMPAEQGYLDSLEKKAEICNNFFSTLFHFPYPRFALSVKGHYGDRVTFMLSVNDFQSSFNSQTGNFEVDIEFIGHMYGLYSDIPLNYLLCAPYMGTDGYTVNQYWRNNATPGGPFTFSDGTSIPTLVEFLGKYENMAESFRQNYSYGSEDTQNIDKIAKIRGSQKLLSRALVEYDNVLNGIGEGNTISKLDTSNYVLYFVKESSINLPSTENLEILIDSYNEEGGQTVSYPSSLSSEFWGFAKETKPSLFNYGKVNNDTVYVLNEEHEYYQTIKGLTDITERLNSLSDEVKGRNVFLVKKELDFINNIHKAISNDDANVNSLLSNSENELRGITKNVLGFVPTIENIYRMIYAHIDCFLSSFYSLLSNINAHKDQRILSKIGNIDISETDVEANGTNEFNIPPFTAFFEKEENNRTRKYPGEIPWLRNLDEVTYVEMLYSSINTVKNTVNEMSAMHQQSQIENVVQEELEQKKKNVSWKPLSFIDYYYDKNPYSYLAVDDPNDFLGYLLYFFKVRMAGANIITDNRNFSHNNGVVKNEIIENEAKNVIAEHSNFLLKNSSFLKDKLKECSENTSKASSVISEFLGKYVNLNDNFYDNSEEFPIIFRNIKNEEDREDISYLSSFEGYNIIEGSENAEANYSDFDNIKNIKDLSCEYKTNNRFKGGIYQTNNKGELVHVDFKGISAKVVRENYENYYFPILQVNEKKIKNLYADKFFTEDITKLEENGIYKKAMIFLSTMVGNNNVYKFDKSNSSILRVPKHLALYFGGLKCIEADMSFLINRNGVHTDDNNTLLNINGYTINSLIAEDKNEKLLTYFKNWVKEEFVKLYTVIQKANEALEEHKEIVKKKNDAKVCFKNGGVISNLLLKFYTDTIDIFKVKTRKNDFNDENLKLFARELYNYIVNNEANTGNTASEEEFTISGEANNNALMVKNSIYYTLKNLYDKWISTYTINTFRLKAPNEDKAIARQKSNGEIINSSIVSEFDSFVFIDTFYNDISDRFLINPETVYSLINPQTKGETNRSCLQFMTDIAQKSNLLFVALPVFNNFYDANSIANIFTPQNLYDGSKKNARGIGNTYVLMYTHEPSHNLNTMKDSKNSTGYDSDGLDIADTTGEILSTAVNAFNNAGYTIPAFGVTFAKQNQMYFKGLTLNMSNPRETDYAIYNRFKLAAQETNGATNAPSPIGQDMFSIYSNRVYDCGVEMMGCANIMPMMYFQLNNVPMYKGAYMITNVKHHIENGSMTTSFSGTRISKNAIPFNQNVIDVESLISKINGGANETGAISTTTIGEGNVTQSDVSGVLREQIQISDSEMYPNIKEMTFNVSKAYNRSIQKMSLNEGLKILPNGPYNAGSSKPGRCAESVKYLLEAGFGIPEGTLKKFATCNGFYCAEGGGYNKSLRGPNKALLRKLNFVLVAETEKLTINSNGKKIENHSWTKENAKPGDVAVMKHGENGHICMFLGGKWISDFNQNNMWVYGSEGISEMYVYRFNGNIIYPSTYQQIIVINSKNFAFKKGEEEITQLGVETMTTDQNKLESLSVDWTFEKKGSKKKPIIEFNAKNKEKGKYIEKNCFIYDESTGVGYLKILFKDLAECGGELKIIVKN